MTRPGAGRLGRAAAATFLIALLAAGCGDDGGDGAETTTTAVDPTPPATTDTTAPTTESTEAPEPTDTTAPPATGAPDGPGELTVTAQRIEGSLEDGSSYWSVSYPVVSGTGFDDQINVVLEGAAQQAIEAWHADTEDWEVVEDLPSELVTNFEVTLLDDRHLSIEVTGSAYLSGAAHPNGIIETFTFDLSTGERIELEDLFDPGSDWRELLVEEAREAIAAEYGELVEIESLDLSSSTDFSAFSLTPGGLRITFGDGQIGPHALGMPSFEIAYGDLASVASASGGLAEYTG